MARKSWIAIVAAATAVVAVAVTGALVRGNDGDPPSGGRDSSLPTEWRTEYWRDMSVDVPADWGYGGAPMSMGGDQLSCYSEAMVGPDGAHLEGGSGEPYVGRPVSLTDVCAMYPDNQPGGPTAPYVWLGADLPIGTVDLGGGLVQETVEVNGSKLTVAADAALRQRILETAVGGETCFSDLERPPTVEQAVTESGPGLTVCAYLGEQEQIGLSYVAEMDDATARKFEAAYARTESIEIDAECADSDQFAWVVLMVEDRIYVVSPSRYGCVHVDGPNGPVRLTQNLARSWAVGGIPAIVYASPGMDERWMYDYFIGPQG